MVWCGVVWCGVVWCVLWCGVVCCSAVVWCGVLCSAVVLCGVVCAVLCGGRQQLTLLYLFAVRRCDTFVWVRSFERKVPKPSSLLCECSQQQLQTTQRIPHCPSLPLSLPRTISVPLKEGCSAHQYMSWLDVLSDSLPPILMMRGNQQSVLTFNS